MTIIAQLQTALEELFGERPLRLVSVAEDPPWASTFVVSLRDGVRWFVKGAPRTQGEGTVTAHLAARCPGIVPTVIHHDLLSADRWQWFVLADAGDCERTEVTPELACRAATALGVLQRTVCGDSFLAARLPSCLPAQLTTISLASCATLMRHSNAAVRAQAQQIGVQLRHVEPALQRAAAVLATVPPTCVHGDFWPGNLALRDDELRLIDWGEVVWGVGAASIWNLLRSSHATLAQSEAAVWEAYSQGLHQPLDAPYRRAARLAFAATMLVVDQQLGAAADGTSPSETLAILRQIIAVARGTEDEQ
jgi:Phosphotransferase enzyme family